jgi:hypothetical protein
MTLSLTVNKMRYRHNDINHNDIQHNGAFAVMLSVIYAEFHLLSGIMLNVVC